ncbi:MAG: hypothetical protein AAFX44_10455 [Pseudomonadota bacterium]
MTASTNSYSPLLSVVLLCAGALLLNGCFNSGSTGNTGQGGSGVGGIGRGGGTFTGNSIGPTYARSFGGPQADSIVDLATDSTGRVWLLGQLPDQVAPAIEPFTTTPTINSRPWLGLLGPEGETLWQQSPESGQLPTKVAFTYGQALFSGGALFAGNGETVSEGTNIFLQRQAADGSVLWRLQLDSTRFWANSQIIAARPFADDTLLFVAGNEDDGWFVVAKSVASVPGLENAAGSVVNVDLIAIWRVTPAGVAPPNEAASVVIRNGQDITYLASTTSVDAGGNRILATLLKARNPQRDQDEVTLVRFDPSNASADGTIVFDAPPTSEETDLLIPTVDAVGSSVNPSIDSGYLHLIGENVWEGVNPKLIKITTTGAQPTLEWTADFDANRLPVLYGLAQTIVNRAGSGIDLWLWAGGSIVRNGERVPALWKIDRTGNVTDICDLPAPISGRSVVGLEARGSGDELRVLVAPVDNIGEAGLIQDDLAEYNVRDDCSASLVQTYPPPSRPLLGNVPFRPVWRDVDGNPIVRTLEIPQASRILRYGPAGGPRAVGLATIRVSDFDVATNITGLAVKDLIDTPIEAWITTDTGQIRQLDDAGNMLLNLDIDQIESLEQPAFNDFGQLWMIGDSGAKLISIDPNSQVVQRYEFPACFWLGAAVTRCRDPEFLAMTEAEGNVVVHARGFANNAAGRGPYRHFLIDISLTGSASWIPLPERVAEPLDFQSSRAVVEVDRGLNGLTLLHTFRASISDPATDADPPGRSAGRSSTLYHYGRTPETRWSLTVDRLAIQDAKLAHDGGVVLLLRVSGNGSTLSIPPVDGADANVGLLKLNETGRPQWLRVYGGADIDTPMQIERIDAGYAIAAESYTVDAVTPASRDLWVFRVGFDGRINGDSAGVDFCQASIDSISEEALYRELTLGTLGTGPAPLTALPAATALPITGSVLAATSLPPTQSALLSTNTARQCAGTATNNQANPFNPRPALSLTVEGDGSVQVEENGTAVDTCTGACTLSFDSGTNLRLVPAPASGFRFDAWIGADCSDTDSDEALSIELVSDLACTARFVTLPPQSQLALTIVGMGTVTSNPSGIDCPTTCIAAFAVPSTVQLTATADAGWEFSAWSGDCDAQGVVTISDGASRNCSATFVELPAQNQLDVTVNGMGSVTSSPTGIDCPTTCTAGFDVASSVQLTARPDAGWELSAWSGDCDAQGVVAISDIPGLSCTATFVATPTTATLTVVVDGPGRVDSPPKIDCGSDCTDIYQINELVSLTATPDPGSSLVRWSGGAGCAGSDLVVNFTMPASDLTCTATFSQQPAGNTVNIAIVGNGQVNSFLTGGAIAIGCPPDCSEPFAPGAPVELIAAPSNGWSFAGWSGDAECTGTAVVLNFTMPSNDVNCTATFVELGVVNVVINGDGIVTSSPVGIACPTDCTEVYPLGTQVLLAATANIGSQFAGWTGDADCVDGAVTVSTTPVTCTATFSQSTSGFTLTLTLEGGPGAGQVDSSETPIPTLTNCILSANPTEVCMAVFPAGANVFLRPTLFSTSTNVIWSGCDIVSAPLEGCTVLMNSDRSVTARFE